MAMETSYAQSQKERESRTRLGRQDKNRVSCVNCQRDILSEC